MKKILILVGRSKNNINTFHTELKRRLPETIRVEIANFEDIIIDIEEKNISIFIGKINIADYDIVYFRRAGKGFLWLAATIALYLESVGKLYFDSTYKEVGPTGTKLNSFVKLALSGLPIVPSIYCDKGSIIKNCGMIAEKLGLPLVAKDLYSQRGLGVSLVKTREDFRKLTGEFPNKKFMFQKFIDKKEEFRVLVLGDKIGSFEKKTSTDSNEFRNNVSLGASEEFINVSDISEEIRFTSVKASKVLNIQIGGVDVVADKAGRIWLLEVNRGPGFTYTSDKSPEMDSVASFFAGELKKTE